MRIAFTTLGCKINQYETDAMQEAVAAEGNAIVPFDGEADVYVVNTCSVTAKSDYQCRQTIRAAVRRAEGARVVVTGCYAQTRPDEIRSIPGVSMVLGNGEKASLARHLAGSVKTRSAPDDTAGRSAHSRTRRFLKVQDGCDSRCSYCIVPLARGASRSVPQEEVVRQFEQAIKEGHPEIVLSGIHIGRYGTDLQPQTTLTALVRDLLVRRKHARVRLSSIEPIEVTDELVGMLGQGLCRHLHIPLQSGDDGILGSMNRHYSSGGYRDIARSLASRVPGIAIGADVMVGFPGETDRAFQNTYDLIDDLPLTHLHVFSYSPRPGTPASVMKHQVPERAKKERNERLRLLAIEKNLRFRERLVGEMLRVVLEGGSNFDPGAPSGLSENYVRVQVEGAKSEHFGREINVLVTELDGSGLKAKMQLSL